MDPHNTQDPRKTPCPYCGRLFNIKTGLAVHIKLGHPGLPLPTPSASSTASQPLAHPCGSCDRSFTTFRGKQLHRKRAHEEDFNNDIPVPKRTRWSEEEAVTLARAEVQLIRSGVQRSDLNYRLREVLSTRTLEAIRERRRNSPHQDLVQQISRETMATEVPSGLRSPSGHRGEEEPHPVPQDALIEVQDSALDSSDVTDKDQDPSIPGDVSPRNHTSQENPSPSRRKRDRRAARLSDDESEGHKRQRQEPVSVEGPLHRRNPKESAVPLNCQESQRVKCPPNESVASASCQKSQTAESAASRPLVNAAVERPAQHLEGSQVVYSERDPAHDLSSDTTTDNALAQDSILSNLKELIAESPEGEAQVRLWAVVRKAIDGLPTGDELNEYLSGLCTAPVRPRQSQVQRPPSRCLTKKARRRQEFAVAQNRYRKHQSRYVKELLDGACESNIRDPKAFVDFWAEIMTQPASTPCADPDVLATTSPELFEIMSPITKGEVDAVLCSQAKAHGPDGITLKQLQAFDRHSLVIILNLLLLQNETPMAIRKARLAFIPKIPRSSDPAEFRPIAVGSYIQRALHKILAHRINRCYEHHPSQRGFIAADGCQENIGVLNALLQDAQHSRRQLHLASVDIRKAFDTVHHGAIGQALRRKGFPTDFIQYITGVYRSSLTVIEVGDVLREVVPTQGVRQGDPLSPFIFNVVIDCLLERLDQESHIGYRLAGQPVRAMAYADDMILVASTRSGLECLLRETSSFLRGKGLFLNPGKCSTLSLIPNKRRKQIKVDTCKQFEVEGEKLPALGVRDTWKYLGIHLDSRGRTTPSLHKLPLWLDRITKAPLKPQQRLEILRQYIIPRLLHTLHLGSALSSKFLLETDNSIRKTVRRWLRLPTSSPTAFIYAPVKMGGLGILSLRTSVPIARLDRIERMRSSSSPVIAAVSAHPSVLKDWSAAQTLMRYQGAELHSKKDEKSFWANALYDNIDGRSLRQAGDAPFTHSWVRDGNRFLSGREFTQMIHLRVNALPTRARLARGRPSMPTSCRIGCSHPETITHLGLCPSVADNVSKRHNDVVDKLARHLRDVRGNTVVKEVTFRADPSSLTGSLRPDLLITRGDSATIIDVQVVGPSRDLKQAVDMKIRKYDTPGIRQQLAHLGCPNVQVGAAVVNTSGIWEKSSVTSLLNLGLSKSKIKDLTCLALQGTLRVWRGYHQVKRTTLT